MKIANGSTDVTTYVVLRDSTNHAPKTDVTLTGINLYYQENLAAQTGPNSVTALTAATDAHADNKAFHCGMGLYRIDWPDAAFDGGVGKRVVLIIDPGTGADDVFYEVELTGAIDPWTVALPGSYSSGQAGYIIGNAPTVATVASGFLHQDLGDGTNDVTLNERTVRSALRAIRNKTSIAAGTLTVTTENDSTTAWTAAVTADAAADPITAIDPAT